MWPMDEILTVVAAGFAFMVLGFLLGILALARVKGLGLQPPRLWKLTPEQTFGLGGILTVLAGGVALLWR